MDATRKPKNTIWICFNNNAQEAAEFYVASFPDSRMTSVLHAPGDNPIGKKGDVLAVESTVLGVHCMGMNTGPVFQHREAFSFQITPRVLTDAMSAGGLGAERAFAAMMTMKNIDVAAVEAAVGQNA